MNDSFEPAGPLLHTITSAAQRLGLARGTVIKLLDTGELRYRRVGADRRIPQTELRRYAGSELIGGPVSVSQRAR
jgi:excisionase family DNA binding protein